MTSSALGEASQSYCPISCLGSIRVGQIAINTPQGPITWRQLQGCPQGSCSGPSFWNLVVDEILEQDWPIGVHLQEFSDDFIFIGDVRTKQEAKSSGNLAIQKFKNWTDHHTLQISLEKSSYIHNNKIKSGPRWYAGIKWSQSSIKRNSVIKYLCITIYKLNFAAHFSERWELSYDLDEDCMADFCADVPKIFQSVETPKLMTLVKTESFAITISTVRTSMKWIEVAEKGTKISGKS
ncbi:hypothetical protein AVEN_8611-1 [Araneus ventricosus]|uniref:Reverse transcriptase domain-containing protein n=1 Tax=Araneus ventricosus TaxID=182803 RepID=A0A4Y2C503_ARAVE|nr:hypothetical protein AVEN_8611-1 [Araneus ventricosus]